MNDNEWLKQEIMSRMSAASIEEKSSVEPQASNVLNISVSFNEQKIICNCSDGDEQTITWDELVGVAIKTTNSGPFVENIFWYLGAKDRSLRIPQSAQGFCDLLNRLQHLPNFDNRALATAMVCTETKLFICWQRDT
ncbi:MAG: hypothetical protein JEZ00_20955 [Anaerolineaceae bacterium]|nr:hypothetical protein [Anaerolineaceae bacterium]